MPLAGAPSFAGKKTTSAKENRLLHHTASNSPETTGMYSPAYKIPILSVLPSFPVARIGFLTWGRFPNLPHSPKDRRDTRTVRASCEVRHYAPSGTSPGRRGPSGSCWEPVVGQRVFTSTICCRCENPKGLTQAAPSSRNDLDRSRDGCAPICQSSREGACRHTRSPLDATVAKSQNGLYNADYRSLCQPTRRQIE